MDSSAPEVAELKRRRWVKLAVDESLFEHLHIAAAKSGLRITPFLRMHLAKAQPFPKERLSGAMPPNNELAGN
jgi:hypothetical protein